MKILYYVIWILSIIIALICTSTIVGSIIGFDSVGTQGLTAGAGIAVIAGKKYIFGILDKIFKRIQ